MKARRIVLPLAGLSLLGAASYAQDMNSQLEVPGDNAKPAPEANLVQLSDEQKVAKFAAANAPVQAILTFDRRLSEGAIKAILSKAGVKPFSVYMALEGMSGFHGVDVTSADISVIGDARRISADQTEKAKGFGTKTLEEIAVSDSLTKDEVSRFAKHALITDDQNDAMLQGFRTGKPIIFAVGITGSAEQIQSLRGRPNVASLMIGNLLESGKVALPRVEAPSEARGRFSRPNLDALAGDALKNEIKRRAGKEN